MARRAFVLTALTATITVSILLGSVTPKPQFCTWTFTEAIWQVTPPPGATLETCLAPGAPAPYYTTPPDRYALNSRGQVALYSAFDQRMGWTAAQLRGHARYGGPLEPGRIEVA